MSRIVSVAATAYKHEKYIKDWCNGLTSQVLPEGWELEVNVVVDASPDNTAQIIREHNWKDIKINLYNAPVNCGASPSMTRALDMCTGELICYLEGDDYYKPGKLLKSIDFLYSRGYDGMCTEVSYLMPDGGLVERGWLSHGIKPPETIVFQGLLPDNRIYSCSFVAKRECFFGGFGKKRCPTPTEIARVFGFLVDYTQFLYMTKQGWKFGYLNEPLSIYRTWIGISNNRPEIVRLTHLVKAWAQRGCPEAEIYG